MIDPAIPAVGVFVEAESARILRLLEDGTIDIAQLYGREKEEEIRLLQKESRKPVWKAFRIRTEADVTEAMNSPADLVVLDNGFGTGSKRLRRTRKAFSTVFPPLGLPACAAASRQTSGR